MKIIRKNQLIPLFLAVFAIESALGGVPPGGTEPLLPVDVDGPQSPALGQNSYGRPIALRGIHNEAIATPDFGQIQIPPFIPTPRYYITIRYYACRPWFRHPYLGTTLTPTDLITNVQSNNPDWPGQGLPLANLLTIDPQTGESLVDIVDEGVVQEGNPIAEQCWQDEQEVEIQNAAALGHNVGQIRPIWHAPYYGLYCLRIRICVPYISATPGNVFNYWVKWRYNVHQRYCWRTWWHYCWFNHPTRFWIRYPWRPMCIPCVFWHRAGPDWVLNICNVNRYRHWCLYGFRYYCNYWTNPVFLNHPPRIGAMTTDMTVPTLDTSGWLRPWPYPFVRYWPYRPYCTRWYWFRPLPWLQYRYLPPLVNTMIAAPDDANGGGFVEVSPTAAQVASGEDQFPLDPAPLDALGNFQDRANFDSFFDVFTDLGECRYRAVEERLGDNDGDGTTTVADSPRRVRSESGEGDLLDTTDDGLMPAVPN